MSIYLDKIVALFALPLGWVLLAGVVAGGLLAAKRRRAAGVVIALQWVVLWVCAMPWLNQRLTGWLEAEYPPVALEATPVAEVAVVLGGAVGRVGDPPTENLSGSSDRVLRAARLYRAGKVDRVLAVGGSQPWLGNPVPEAEAMRDLLVEWGVPAEHVLTETASWNTRENARNAAAIIRAQGWTRVLLVTSATHMRRAVAAFRAAGIAVIPSATDYAVVGPQPLDVLDFMPDVAALDGVSFALRELLGRAYYQLRAWVGA